MPSKDGLFLLDSGCAEPALGVHARNDGGSGWRSRRDDGRGGHGLLLQSLCIPSVPQGHDYRDIGGRVMHGAITEATRSLEVMPE